MTGGAGQGSDDPAEAMMARDAASASLGLEVVEVRPGYARVRMTVAAHHLNGHDIVHGGFLFTLADTAFACACNSGRSTTVAAQAEIDFLASAHLGDVLAATAVERISVGRSGITDVSIRRVPPDADGDGDDEGDQGDVIAEFRGRSRTLRVPEP